MAGLKKGQRHSGQFKPGMSGNPGGRPAVLRDIQTLARQYTTEAIEALADILRNEKAPPAAKVAVANALLDRGYGKAPQTVGVNVNPLDRLNETELKALEACITSISPLDS